ncbi:uncharacterized protein LOC128315389 [Acinonyx jubatus]|uniref:Uncharacterized protein LOC128315389 n=1 Tax=Acinonyx jubatus TaxID=32536 RepID=A0ABM3Q1S7_ACIJB|nr:uncharacterized protein LOC128315389 [Acinonyx jubatus]
MLSHMPFLYQNVHTLPSFLLLALLTVTSRLKHFTSWRILWSFTTPAHLQEFSGEVLSSSSFAHLNFCQGSVLIAPSGGRLLDSSLCLVACIFQVLSPCVYLHLETTANGPAHPTGDVDSLWVGAGAGAGASTPGTRQGVSLSGEWLQLSPFSTPLPRIRGGGFHLLSPPHRQGAPHPASLPAGSRRGVHVQSRAPADARASWRQAASRPQLGLRGRTRSPRPPPLSARGGAGRARGAPAPLSAVTWGRAQQVSGLAPSAGNAERTPETAALRVALGGGSWVQPRNSGGDRRDLARGGRSCEETGSLRPTFCKRLGDQRGCRDNHGEGGTCGLNTVEET